MRNEQMTRIASCLLLIAHCLMTVPCRNLQEICMKKGAKKTKKFIAVVEEDQAEKIDDIADQLKKEGAQIDQVMSFTGIITGSTPDMQKLNGVRGIKSVEEDRENFAI